MRLRVSGSALQSHSCVDTHVDEESLFSVLCLGFRISSLSTLPPSCRDGTRAGEGSGLGFTV
jgi:hypothetical protein